MRKTTNPLEQTFRILCEWNDYKVDSGAACYKLWMLWENLGLIKEWKRYVEKLEDQKEKAE